MAADSKPISKSIRFSQEQVDALQKIGVELYAPLGLPEDKIFSLVVRQAVDQYIERNKRKK